MCGILGIIGDPGSTERSEVERRLLLLAHRGPDGSGIWQDASRRVWLAHRRLSIIDPTDRAAQPMSIPESLVSITFNGELYNHQILRVELENHGFRFRTSSDTEVLLAAYLHWDTACLDHLNGMFAFGLFDGRPSRQRVFLARDRIGQKPLYYASRGHSFEFASETGPLSATEVDPISLEHYLALGYVPRGMTIAKGITHLEPGTAMTVDVGDLTTKTWRYWSPPFYEETNRSISDLAEHARELCETSVERCLVSDVPLVVFLSGGLDSGLVTALAARTPHARPRAITVSFEGSAWDETTYARATALRCGVDHLVLTEATSFGETINQIASKIDEPTGDSSIVPTFMVSKAASGVAKVALGGDGGDEVFGGYGHHQNAALPARRLPTLRRGVAAVLTHLPAGIPGRRRALSIAGSRSDEPVLGTSYFDPSLRKRIAPDLRSGVDLPSPERQALDLGNKSHSVIERTIRRDLLGILPSQYLMKTDRAGMWNGLEIRAPLLDHELVEFVYRCVPPEFKVTKTMSRVLQRTVATEYLPSEVSWNNRKRGFSFPLEQWLRSAASKDLILEQFEYLPEGIDRAYASSLLDSQQRGLNNGSRLFALFTLAAACRNRHLA